MPRLECSRLEQTEFTRLYIQDRLHVKMGELARWRAWAKVGYNDWIDSELMMAAGAVDVLIYLLKDICNIKKRIDRQRRREKIAAKRAAWNGG